MLRCAGLPRRTTGCISFDRHCLQRVKELPALTYEKPVLDKACNRSDCTWKSISKRTNDRDLGKVGADEFAAGR